MLLYTNEEIGFDLTKFYEFAAGYDICTPLDFNLLPKSSIKINTEIIINIPDGFCGYICNKSHIAIRDHYIVPKFVENNKKIFLNFNNLSDKDFKYIEGCKIAQLIIQEIGYLDKYNLNNKNMYYTCEEDGIDLEYNNSGFYYIKSPIDFIIKPGELYKCDSKIRINLNNSHYAHLLNYKKLDIIGGIIDSDYTGNIIVLIKNNTNNDIIIKRNDIISTMAIIKIYERPIKKIELDTFNKYIQKYDILDLNYRYNNNNIL